MSPAKAAAPTLDVERQLALAGARYVAGMDEVGRGALAGPASVGVVVVDAARWLGPEGDVAPSSGLSTAPSAGAPWEGVRDSKALSAARRAAVAPTIPSWAAARGVGHAEPSEIDAVGINAALRLAGLRALAAVHEDGVPVDALILDGSYNWLDVPPVLGQDEDPVVLPPVVRTLVKADAQCVSVAAASIVAKVERDDLMAALDTDYPAYGWAGNKGYGSVGHREALTRYGSTPHHRVSWNLGI
ncbi:MULTISPECIES: ribonuclease HII [Kocuria]|uniref:Ribonuclease n=1 Tax=Kocuria salsicia TaxID=664639 RepID=A0ABV3K8N1_9MICC|nr:MULTISPECIES: ribonuclease HII [Kocuria]